MVEPASDYMVTKLGEGFFYIANVTEPARQYIHKNVPPLLEKVCYCKKCSFGCERDTFKRNLEFSGGVNL